MTNEKGGRILDKDFEDGIRNRANELQREAQDDITMAQKYAYGKNDEVETMIKEHPKAFVLGSFVGGVALGTLLSKKSE